VNVSSWHRIARQSVELQVESESAARELHAELAASFAAALAPAIDDVLDAASPPGGTLRIERLEIDLGVVPRDRLLEALTAGTRDRLAAMLGAARDPGILPSVAANVATWVSDDEIALERLAVFLEYGAMTWRDAGFSRADVEQSLLAMIERAPAALRDRLRRVPPARAARRIITQLAPAARLRLLKWLGVDDADRVEQILADWIGVLTRIASRPGWSSTHGWHRDAAEPLFESLWAAAMRGGSRVSALDVISETAVAAVEAALAHVAPVSQMAIILATAEARLAPESGVRQFVIGRAAAMRALNPLPDKAPSPDGSLSAHAAGSREETRAGGSNPPSVGHAAEPGIAPSPSSGATLNTESARSSLRRESSGCDRTDTPPRTHTPFVVDPLWAANAGVVILWPFLPGLFDACGLTREKHFVDPPARARAVLLTAHLADGGSAWDEQELLLAKLLCGHPADESLAASLELRHEERESSADLLLSVIGHWQALKKTSVDGLREAFLRRNGTLTAIASGWKLEVARTGYDVLLDALPWGIGLVLLPWMEQPLHVEW
jgi:hypothetical protein